MSTDTPQPINAYIALGSNLGDRHHNLRRALDLLNALPHTQVLHSSDFYETTPRFVEDQPDFLNACAHLLTSLSARTLLNHLLDIELNMGRIRTIDKGPRILDLDLLFYADQIIDEEGLSVPHPDLHNRDFVLLPLIDIAPDLLHPRLQRTIRDLASSL